MKFLDANGLARLLGKINTVIVNRVQEVQSNVGSLNENVVHKSGTETIDGTKTFSSVIAGSIDGNAATATTLKTSRNINGTSFNGSSAITTANWGTARNISISDSDGTNTGTAVSVNGSANVTLKLPATIKASITGNCSGSSGSCTGNAATATKLATARTISAGDLEFQGSASFDGSGDIALNVTQHRCIVSVGNTNNYPFHRIAYTAIETGNYVDRGITFFVGREYNGSGYGICRIIFRTNNASGGNTASCDVQWLVRTAGMPADTIQVGFNNTAAASYVDVFYKANGTYASAICRVMSHSNARNSVGRGFTIVAASTEVSNTTASNASTSTESYATIAAAGTSIRGKDYTSTITAGDVGTVGTAAKLATARTINGVSFDGSANITVADSTKLPLAGGSMTGDLKITTSTMNQIRLIQGNYGVLLRNDGSNFYLLQTASGSAEDGSWNSARPLTVNLSTGICTINGNAATATKLATARAINGTNFDGSAAITTANWGTARNISISDSDGTNTGSAVSVNGSGNATLKLPATIKASITGNCSGSSGSCTGNAASATITKGNKNTGSYVTSVKSGNALVNADNTQFATIYNAPTKSYRVGCATWPDNGENIIWYSITNANVSSSTNTTNKIMTWNAGTGVLTATGFVGPLTGNVTGNCSGSSGSCTGNAATATKLGTSTIGSTYQPIYLNGGTATACGYTFAGQHSNLTKGTNPSSTVWTHSWIRYDKNGTDTANRLTEQRSFVNASGVTGFEIGAYDYRSAQTGSGWIGIYNNNGSAYTSAPTPANYDNTTKIATTAFVYNNAAKHISANTSIYVAKAATGNGSGSNTSNYMSLADLRLYLSTVHMHSSTADMNGSYTLTLLFKAGDSFGNATIDSRKIPGVRSIIMTTSTGTASTSSNYSTNSPTFGSIAVLGNMAVTMRNLNCTGTISAQYGSYVSIDTYIAGAKFQASNNGYLNIAKNTIIDVCDAHTDYLFLATTNGFIAMWPGATITINFRNQCYYSRALFATSANGTLWLGYSSLKLTGTQPVSVWSGSGTLTCTSSTAAGTAAKVATLESGQTFTLAANATAKVKFTVDNTAANPTLNINSTGAKPIYWNGAAVAANMIIKNFIYDVKYDGTNYVIQNAVKRLTTNDFGIFRTSGNYNQTYNSGSWNFTGWNLYYGTGIENSNWRGNHIGNIQQNVTASNNTYPVLFCGTANATANSTTYPYFGSGVKINPSTSTVYATTFSGAFSGNVTGNCSGSSGSCTGNAATATKLATARSLKTKLNSTTAVTFDGSAAQDSIPVTGTLGLANGGTGATTRLAALQALTNENVGTNATYFLTITNSWGKGGYSSTANAKTVLGVTGSDRRIKDDIESIPEEILDAWENVSWKQFKMKKEVREKGENAAIHAGAVVQDIQKALVDGGVDSDKYGFLYHEDYLPDEKDLPSEENPEITNGEKWYLKYDEALSIEAAYLRRKCRRLEESLKDALSRISALEAKGD